MYDETAYEVMFVFRKPFITVHCYGFYALTGFAVIYPGGYLGGIA